MKTNPNPPGYLPAATSWEAKGDGVSVRMRIEPASPVAGSPSASIWSTRACTPCIVEFRFGDDSTFFVANNNRPCGKGRQPVAGDPQHRGDPHL